MLQADIKYELVCRERIFSWQAPTILDGDELFLYLLRADLTIPEMLHLHAGCEQMIQLPLSFDAAIFQHDNMVGASQHCAAMRDGQHRHLLARKHESSRILRMS